jgi:hypothetical protein
MRLVLLLLWEIEMNHNLVIALNVGGCAIEGVLAR